MSPATPFFSFWKEKRLSGSRGKRNYVNVSLDHMSMIYKNVSAFAFYFNHDFDWFYSFYNLCVYQIAVCLAPFHYPIAVSDLALEPFSACEASVFFNPSCWLRA